MTDKNNVTRAVYDKQKIVDSYSKAHNDINTIKQHANRFMSRLNGSDILDVGCGPGRDIKYFIDGGFNVLGLDTSKRFLEKAIKKAPDAVYLLENMKNVGKLGIKFNGIWSCGSFYHLEKKDALSTLKGFYDALHIGGQLYLGVKEGKGEKFIKRKEFLGEEKFYSFYNFDEIAYLVEQAGFRINNIVMENKEFMWINIFAEKKI